MLRTSSWLLTVSSDKFALPDLEPTPDQRHAPSPFGVLVRSLRCRPRGDGRAVSQNHACRL
jgi:hypothetical protein